MNRCGDGSELRAAQDRAEPAHQEELILRISTQVAARFARRCWWADKQDLTNQAYACVLSVKLNTKPDNFAAAAYTAASRHLGRYTARQGSPVSVGRDSWVKQLVGTTSQEVYDDSWTSAHTPEDTYGLAEVQARLRERIFALCGRDPSVEASILVLMEDRTPSEAAAETGVDVRRVYKANEWVRASVRTDDTMRHLGEQLIEHRRKT